MSRRATPSQPITSGTTEAVTHEDVSALALGCAVLGAGGGGNVEAGIWAAQHVVGPGSSVEVVSIGSLPGDGVVMPLGAIGAPTISQEMLPSGHEPALIRDEVERLTGRPVVALMPSEIGGANGVRSVGWAKTLGVPLIDADGMGRAFPEIHMKSMDLAGIPPNLVVLADVVGNITVVRATSGHWAEKIARASCVASGSTALMSAYVMTVEEAETAVVKGTITRALMLGRILLDDATGVAAVCETAGGRELITGKIIELERRDAGGFVRGSVVISGLSHDSGRLARVEIQNENLVVLEDGRCLASVPDIIVLLDSETGRAISTDALQFGQRVTAAGLPCDDIWRTPAGLLKTGPRAFGYDLDYHPVEQQERPKNT